MATSRSWRTKAVATAFLGSILLQGAWCLTIPPYLGNDEVDHAYRAGEVASGRWNPHFVAASEGRGGLVNVPGSIVAAAGPACRSLKYNGPDNCDPVAEDADGTVTVASAASQYEPVFYWIIGTAAKPFSGDSALFVMRATTIFMCSALITLSVWLMSLWARTCWPFVSLVVALSPVAVYSMSIAAPNGVEMAAAIALWACMLGLARGDLNRATSRTLITVAPIPAVLLAALRALGPLWLCAIAATALMFIGRDEITRKLRFGARRFYLGLAVTTMAVVASVAWTVSARTNFPSATTDLHLSSPLSGMIRQLPLWALQTVAAFPRRLDAAPAIVYIVWLMLFGSIITYAWRQGDPRTRRPLATTLIASFLIPAVVTLITYSHVGPAWQGRYGLPYAFGIVLLAGYGLDGKRFPKPVLLAAILGGSLMVTVALGVSIAGVEALLRDRTPNIVADSLTPSVWILVAMVSAGVAAWAQVALQFL